MSLDRQFDLEEPATGSRLTCWLKDDPRLKVGIRVTLKETGAARYWRIVKRYTHVVEDHEINRHWRVGGLS
jgi:hypothetical protein